MLDKIFSSNVRKTNLLIDWHAIEKEDFFVHSPIFSKVDSFSVGRKAYVKLISEENIEEFKKKFLNDKNNGLCNYVIFDGEFKIEISYKNRLIFYLSVEKYSERSKKDIFVDDAGLFSKFWDDEDGSLKIGDLTLYIHSNQLLSISQQIN